MGAPTITDHGITVKKTVNSGGFVEKRQVSSWNFSRSRHQPWIRLKQGKKLIAQVINAIEHVIKAAEIYRRENIKYALACPLKPSNLSHSQRLFYPEL